MVSACLLNHMAEQRASKSREPHRNPRSHRNGRWFDLAAGTPHSHRTLERRDEDCPNLLTPQSTLAPPTRTLRFLTFWEEAFQRIRNTHHEAARARRDRTDAHSRYCSVRARAGDRRCCEDHLRTIPQIRNHNFGQHCDLAEWLLSR